MNPKQITTIVDSSQWYLDHASLLNEIKRLREAISPTPSIPGYEEFYELQRGGQGVIYLAMQRSTKRRVAIKVLLDGAFASSAARRRFEREIELVASVRHPNIVKIYDSGITAAPDERPFFVMEYIDGTPLLEFIKSKDRRQILECFAIICDAVNHAHQRGVIHRDLKPSNIRIDSGGQPQILDFGLAKIPERDSLDPSDRSVISVAGQFFGSGPWASPEQAAGEPNIIDTRSDIYSLGVILYVALTGLFPYPVEGTLQQTLDTILHVPPARPSAVDRNFHDDLETIVLKSLAKEPARRYQNASDMARDIRHYLQGEPIDARRDSAWYTMTKNLRRYRAAAWVTAMLMIVASIGFGMTYWQARIAQRERQHAERRFNDVRRLAHTFMFDFHDQIRDLAGARPARELLVITALQYLEKLANEAGDDVSLRTELAAAYSRIGDIQGNPYMPNLGNTAGAMESYQKAHALHGQVAAANPRDPRSQALLAKSFNQIGDVHHFNGDHAAAAESFTQALATLEPALKLNPNDATIRREAAASNTKLGDVRSWTADSQGALRHFRAALAIIQLLVDATPEDLNDGINLSVCHSKIGFLLARGGDLAGALDHHRRALDNMLRLEQAHPNNGRLRRGIEINHNQIGATLSAMGEPEAALECFNAALDIAQRMVDADPRDTLAASDLAYTHNKIGDLHLKMNRPDAALVRYRQALDVRERLSANDANNASFRRDLAISCIKVADASMALGRDESKPIDEREDHWKQAIASYGRSRAAFLTMREQGTLTENDAAFPEELAQSVLNCEESLAKLIAHAQ